LNGKPILALKVGESTIGAKSIASHTGALAGSHETYNAIFAQSGVIRVETLEELFDYAIAFAYQPIPSFDDDGKNITIRNNIDIDTTNNKNHKIIADTTTKTVGTAIVSNAGGPAAIVADIAERYNLKLAELTGETVNELKRVLPKTASSIINPVDIIGDADHIRYEKALRAILKDPNVNSCIVISTPQMMLNIKSLVNIIIKINEEFREKTLLTCIMTVPEIGKNNNNDNNNNGDILRRLDENKIPQYVFPESAARSMYMMQKYWSCVIRPRTSIRIFDDIKKEIVKELFADVKKQWQNQENGSLHKNIINDNNKNNDNTYYYISGEQATSILNAYGFKTPTTKLATNEDECMRFSDYIGYPVALKISSPHIVHKTDVGGVELNLRNSQEVKDAFRRIIENVKQKSKNGNMKINRVIIQEFITSGKETIIGMKRDAQFGPLLMFGLGGIYVQVFKDVSFRLAPINELSARHMIESTKASKLLYGVRGEKPSDIESIIESLQRLSQLVMDFPEIQEIDINPLLVFEQGKGCKAIDIRIVIS
jgi:acyl-CoA synthetase (NDP forming)